MNKKQELDVMILRAKIKADEEMKQHMTAWYGEEVEIVEDEQEE